MTHVDLIKHAPQGEFWKSMSKQLYAENHFADLMHWMCDVYGCYLKAEAYYPSSGKRKCREHVIVLPCTDCLCEPCECALDGLTSSEEE